MWHDTRRGHNLIRKRYTTRRFKLNVVSISVIVACAFVVVFSIVGMVKLIKGSDNTKANIDNNDDTEKIIEVNSKVNIYTEEQIQTAKKEFNITFLGEMMMGGQIGDDLNYNYMSAFKNISEYTSKADYTVLNLATNVIDLQKISDAKSKYIVTTNILNAFNALGVDGINIANDHILDFGGSVFKDTKNILSKDYDLIGLKNTIVYAEHDGIKVALIGVCNEVIGTESKYTNAGVMMYNLKKLQEMIKEAKKSVNTVILLTHLGLENTYEITDIMSWFYKELIKSGADAVFGSHALGIYPIEIYKNKPIIYSMGYLMSDTDYAIGKETGVFNLKINEAGNIEELKITPLYINAKKQTILYNDYDSKKAKDLLNLLVSELEENKYNISNNQLTVKIK